MSAFWLADTDQERLEMLRTARNGGSITPHFDKILQRHRSSGRLTISENNRISRGEWSDTLECWLNTETDRPILNFPTCIDHVIYATGNAPDFDSISCLQDLQGAYPIPSISGLPQINRDLMWNDNIPCFFTGNLAGLRLGPGAGNLAGARQGAERIAWKIEELIRHSRHESSNCEAVTKNGGEGQASDRVVSTRPGLSQQGMRIENSGKDRSDSRDDFTGTFYNKFHALSTSSASWKIR